MVTNTPGNPKSNLSNSCNEEKLKFIDKGERGNILTALLVCGISFLVFLTSLRGEFVNMDDDVYIYNNLFIHSFDARFFKWAFGSFYVSNWHPLTWVSHGVDYAFWGLNPLGHHLGNNLLHAANAFLVVIVVMRLLASWQAGKLTSQQAGKLTSPHNPHLIAAGVTGLLFGIHPVHVESVAWVSERKDVPVWLFFLLSIMMYLKYAANASQRAWGIGQTARQIGHGARGMEHRVFDTLRFALCSMRFRALLSALCFFVLALMSKPMAVTLPAVLLILDWYPLGRIPSLSWGAIRGVIAEKVPFIVFSLVSSVMTILAQHSGGSLMQLETLPLSTRLIESMNALVAYLWKMVLAAEPEPRVSLSPGCFSLVAEVSRAGSFGHGHNGSCRGGCEKAKDMACGMGILCDYPAACARHYSGRAPANGGQISVSAQSGTIPHRGASCCLAL